MATLIRWIWIWASFGSRWWTGKPDMLQSMGSQRIGYDSAELNWTEITKVMHLLSVQVSIHVQSYELPCKSLLHCEEAQAARGGKVKVLWGRFLLEPSPSSHWRWKQWHQKYSRPIYTLAECHYRTLVDATRRKSITILCPQDLAA